MKNLWSWLDGKKTIIGAILMLTVNSDYIASLIMNPDLYLLLQSLSMAIFGGGLIHKAVKPKSK